MEKRVLERLMFATMIIFCIALPYGFYHHMPVVEGFGSCCAFVSMAIWIELDRIHSRERELDRKYGRRKRR